MNLEGDESEAFPAFPFISPLNITNNIENMEEYQSLHLFIPFPSFSFILLLTIWVEN